MIKARQRNNKTGIIIIIFVLIFIGVTNTNAYAFLGIGESVSWKEEVLLHDGTKIIAERSQSYGGSHEIGQTPPVKEQTIRFTLPGTNKTVKWHDEFGKEIGRSNFNLLALHILNDTPYIITNPRGCLSYNKWGRPNPPYVIFKYINKEWQRIEIADLPAEFENINLVINTESHDKKLASQDLVSTEMVKKLNSSLKQPEFKTILRTPIKIWCEEEIYDGERWYGFSDLDKQPSYEACLNVCKASRIKMEFCPCKKYFKNNTKGEK